MREQPRHHDFVPRNLALSLMWQGKYGEAAEILHGLLASDTRDVRLKVQASRDLVVLAKLSNNQDDFVEATNDLKARAPNMTIGQVEAMMIDKAGNWKATYLEALREAGIPEG